MCRNKIPTLGLGANMILFNVPWCRFLFWCGGNYSWSSWDSQIQQRQPKGSNNLVNVSNFEGVLSRLQIFAIIYFFSFFLSEIFAFQFHLLMQVPGMIFIRKYLVCSLKASTEQCLNYNLYGNFLWYLSLLEHVDLLKPTLSLRQD